MSADDLDPAQACGTRNAIEIENLHVEIDGKKILKVVDLEVIAGEVHAIIGPNGSAEVDILAQAPAQEIFT
jgi:Fe-S cluster assembly ATP-binding protein